MTQQKPTNPFSPDYVSQIAPFKRITGAARQKPVLLTPVKYFQDNIAPNQDGKQARLLKAAI